MFIMKTRYYKNVKFMVVLLCLLIFVLGCSKTVSQPLVSGSLSLSDDKTMNNGSELDNEFENNVINEPEIASKSYALSLKEVEQGVFITDGKDFYPAVELPENKKGKNIQPSFVYHYDANLDEKIPNFYFNFGLEIAYSGNANEFQAVEVIDTGYTIPGFMEIKDGRALLNNRYIDVINDIPATQFDRFIPYIKDDNFVKGLHTIAADYRNEQFKIEVAQGTDYIIKNEYANRRWIYTGDKYLEVNLEKTKMGYALLKSEEFLPDKTYVIISRSQFGSRYFILHIR